MSPGFSPANRFVAPCVPPSLVIRWKSNHLTAVPPAPKSPPANDGLAPKLKTVAKTAGVSTSTASRALQNSPQIALATRRRIQEIAKQLGYHTNPYVSVLMAHVRQTRPPPYTATLAWIDRLPPNAWRENPVQTLFFNGAVARAEALGFRIERVPCHDPKLNPSRLGDILRSRGINGVLCSADRPDARLMELPLDPNAVAVATVGCRFTKPDLHFSTNDQFITARMGHRRLIDLVYQRVGFVTTRSLEEIVDHRFSGGYLSVLATRTDGLGIPVFFADENDDDAFASWLRRYQPDAVLTTFMIDVLAKIRGAGLRVPQDVAFAMLDWNDTLPDVAGIRQDHERVGAGAVDVLVSQIKRNEFGVPVHPQGVLIEGEWVDGKTAPSRRSRRKTAGPGLG